MSALQNLNYFIRPEEPRPAQTEEVLSLPQHVWSLTRKHPQVAGLEGEPEWQRYNRRTGGLFLRDPEGLHQENLYRLGANQVMYVCVDEVSVGQFGLVLQDFDPLLEENKARSVVNTGLQGLDQGYVIEDRPSVASFIETYRLRGLLLEAPKALKDAFGEVVKALIVIRDDEGFDTLFCYVRTSAEMQAARNSLARFDASWWLGASGSAAGRLNFDFELI